MTPSFGRIGLIVSVCRASHTRKELPQPGHSTSSGRSCSSWIGLWQWGQRMRRDDVGTTGAAGPLGLGIMSIIQSGVRPPHSKSPGAGKSGKSCKKTIIFPRLTQELEKFDFVAGYSLTAVRGPATLVAQRWRRLSQDVRLFGDPNHGWRGLLFAGSAARSRSVVGRISHNSLLPTHFAFPISFTCMIFENTGSVWSRFSFYLPYSSSGKQVSS